jgi:ferredoxin
MANFWISMLVVVLILGGPLTLYALIKITLSITGAPRAKIVKSTLTEEGRPLLGLLVTFDDEADFVINRVKLDFYELVRGGRSASFSFTFPDKSAKKRSFLIPMKLTENDYATLTDGGLSNSPRALSRSYLSVEIEDPNLETIRLKIAKKEILKALSADAFTAPSEIETLEVKSPDTWSVLTRVFPWRKVVEEVATSKDAKVAHAPKDANAPRQEVDFAVTKVWIEPGCIVCDACENEAPLVFHVLADTCIVRENAPLDDAAAIKAAAEGCPVDVIKYTTIPKPKVA